MISKNHPNRQAHNWLAYQYSDHHLERSAAAIRGVTYDLGCGEKPYRDFVISLSSSYVGVDWQVRSSSSPPDIIADLEKPLPIESESADTVLALSVIEHLREPGSMLREAHRILRPGGSIVGQVPFQWWVHEGPQDYFRPTNYGLVSLLEKAGFEAIRVEPLAGFFSMWFLKMNYFSTRFIRGPRLVKVAVRLALRPVWWLSQKAAPHLDSLDRDWAAETPAYGVVARKPVLGLEYSAARGDGKAQR